MDTATSPDAAIEPPELDAIESTVRASLPSFLAVLERLVNTDCGSYTKAGVDKVGAWAARKFEELGAVVERRDHATLGGTVIGTWEGRPGTGPRVLLIGHMDTVFDEGVAADRPFRIEEGVAYGPGVTDMKGGLLAGIYAIAALREHAIGGSLPFERLVYVANPDEEIGSPSSSPHIREIAANSDVCFVLECARANGDIVSARKG